jgi:hypothetical protein
VSDSGVRLNELLMALSLATDLGFGQPAEHMVRSARLGRRLGERLGLSDADLAVLYDVGILTYVGCPVYGNEAAALGTGSNAALAGLTAGGVPSRTVAGGADAAGVTDTTGATEFAEAVGSKPPIGRGDAVATTAAVAIGLASRGVPSWFPDWGLLCCATFAGDGAGVFSTNGESAMPPSTIPAPPHLARAAHCPARSARDPAAAAARAKPSPAAPMPKVRAACVSARGEG